MAWIRILPIRKAVVKTTAKKRGWWSGLWKDVWLGVGVTVGLMSGIASIAREWLTIFHPTATNAGLQCLPVDLLCPINLVRHYSPKSGDCGP